MNPTSAPDPGTLVHSYLFLRRAIGLIGMTLPVVLILGQLLADGGLLDSISDYYHGGMRDVFVGAMFAVGVFLLTYRGYGPADDVPSDIAAVAAVGLALFPTTPTLDPTRADRIVGVLHIVFAGVFFLMLAYFCIVLFRRTDQERPGRRKIMRNHVYLAAGVVILASLALIGLVGFILDIEAGPPHPVLWLESAAIVAFGVAWMVKGETILRDQPAGELAPPPAPRLAQA